MVYNNKRLEEPKRLLGYRHLGKRGCLKYLWKDNDALCEPVQKDFLNLIFFIIVDLQCYGSSGCTAR